MKIVGGVGNDVALRQRDLGAGLSIELAESGDSTYRWELIVDVTIPEGRFTLGRVLTIGPTSSTNRRPSRVVALAMCPGAIGWVVTARAQQPVLMGPPANLAVADLRLASSKCCFGLPFPGVFPVNGAGGIGRDMFAASTQTFNAVHALTSSIGTGSPDLIRAALTNNDPIGGNPVFLAPQGSAVGVGYQVNPQQTFEPFPRSVWVVSTSGPNVPVSVYLEIG